MSRSALAVQIASGIVSQIKAGLLAPGAHLATESLAQQFSVSRSPVREALRLLIDRGVVEQRQNRGCFVSSAPPEAANDISAGFEGATPEDAYFRFADDWLMDRIDGEVTELFMRKRYGLSKAQTQAALARASKDGWAEPKPGYGWRLKDVAKTPEAYNAIYRFRAVIEPAALLEPTFRYDREIGASLRHVQERLAVGDFRLLNADSMIGAGVNFHEELIAMSGSPMFVQALERANQLRRIVEYRLRVRPDRVIQQSREHLQILDHLETGHTLEAAHAMKQHLIGALRVKAPIVYPGEDG
jgi:DNA-binding GntR family transcriptional regulator